MKISLFTMTTLCLAFSAACGGGGGGSVSIVGATPEDAAVEIADTVCNRDVECGDWDITCESTQMGVDCTGTITPVNYDACYAENHPEILADLQACSLTTDQQETVQECINAVLAQDCITQEELDAAVVQIEMGAEEVTLREQPPECVPVEAIFASCSPG